MNEAKAVIEWKDISFARLGEEKQKFSLTLKKRIFLLVGLVIPMSMLFIFLNNLIGKKMNFISSLIGVLAEATIIGLMLYCFFKHSQKYLENSEYQSFSYDISKLMYISYFSAGFGMDKGNPFVNLVVSTFLILTFVILYHIVEKNLILQEVNRMFNKNYKVFKSLNLLLKFSGWIIVIILVGMQLYRLNKSWVDKNYINSMLYSDGLFNDFLGIFIGIPMLLAITLIPTYFLFRPVNYVKGKLIKMYSEEFRQEYGFTKQEWYGEDS
ncbi:hypothetical protein [Enterococcus faecalis]|uniref:hypothetical protein n=2 Tax=Enterococcus TaxID=1350 RepID=UPI003BA20DE3